MLNCVIPEFYGFFSSISPIQELRRQLKLHPARTERECVPVGEGTDKNIPLVAKTSSSASIHEGCSGGSIEAGGGARRSDHERVSTEEVVGAAQTLPLAGGGGMGSDGAHRVVSAEAVSALQEQVGAYANTHACLCHYMFVL